MKYTEQMLVMPVKLISYSKGQNGDLLQEVAYCARVSNPSNQANEETSEKLLKYLMKHKHWSPFEMVSVCLEIKTTRDIARQILRHRSFSFQEFSQRYAEANDYTTRKAREQDKKNRQNSTEFEDREIVEWFNMQQMKLIRGVKELYTEALGKGIAKEQARAILPEGMTESTLYMNGTLRSWMHYIDLRTANGTQKEHMDIASECADAIEEVFPMIQDFNHDEEN
jgi:thymidylate synthase (FAD)